MYEYKLFLEKLRSNCNISQIINKSVNLKKHGNEFIGLCPFHGEKTPSFTVNDNKKFYHCFGCGAHGDVIKFVMEIHKFSFKEAIESLATELALPLPIFTNQYIKSQPKNIDYLYQINVESASWYQNLLLNSKDLSVMKYLFSRGINKESIEKFKIGYSEHNGLLTKFLLDKGYKNEEIIEAGILVKTEKGSFYERFRYRIIFPIADSQNRIVALGGRILNGNLAKYINSNESQIFNKSEILYGEYLARIAAREKNRLILVEGYTDVIMMHQIGFGETVATLGTAVTTTHLQKMWNISKNLLVFLDNDTAGKKAMIKIALASLQYIKPGFSLKFVFSRLDQDPADLCQELSHLEIENLLNNAISLSSFLWLDQKSQSITNNTPEEIAVLEDNINKLLISIHDKRIRDNFKLFFKDKIWDEFRKKSKYVSNKRLENKPNLFQIKDLSLQLRLEHSLLYLIICTPTLLKNSHFLEEFLSYKFENQILASVSHYIIEFYNKNLDYTNNLTKENLENFLNTNLLLESFSFMFKNKAFFLDKTMTQNEEKASFFFNIIILKLQLIHLQLEYENYLQKFTESSIIQSQAILEEMKILKEKIENLELVNYNDINKL